MKRNINVIVVLCASMLLIISCGFFSRGSSATSAEPFTKEDSPSNEIEAAPTVETVPTKENTPVLPEGVGKTRVRPTDGMTMLYIPEGEFMMGSEQGDYDVQPTHSVFLNAYWMDETEVTIEMFNNCVNAGNCKPPSRQPYDGAEFANYPVTFVDWFQAMSYCGWAGGRLPTEAEWEKAARGGLDQKSYPWGNEAPVCTPGASNGANSVDCGEKLLPIKQFSSNGYGLYDMAGNVSEWVNDWYDPHYYANSPSQNPSGPSEAKGDTRDSRVRRGGGYENLLGGLKVTYRVAHIDFDDDSTVGFRCVVPE